MNKPTMSPDVLALNPELSQRDSAQARLPGDIYRSELERRAAREWCPLVFAWWRYEPFKLIFPGGVYTPDFFGMTRAGLLAVVEIKGWNRNLRADKLKFSVAHETHRGWLQFCWVEYKDGGWLEKWQG
jgi:hypothetical protein